MNDMFHSGAWMPRSLNVYTGGTFDLFHKGHVNLLRQCRLLAGGGMVTVGLNTDEFAATYKRQPVCSLGERFAVVEACRHVDRVLVNWDGADSRTIVESVAPDLVVVGDDWKDRDYNKQMGWDEDWLSDRGIEIVFVPYTDSISTSDIIARL
jgi:cytidyltransferase-like protein